MMIRRTWMMLAALAVCGWSGARTSAADPATGDATERLGPNHPAVVAQERREKQMAAVEDELRVRLADAELELAKLRAQMREANGGRPVEGLREAVAAIQQDATRLRIDLAGAQARKEAVEKAITAARRDAVERSDGDAVAAQYRELVKLLEQGLKQAKEAHAAGVVQAGELRQAEISLAEANIKLLERQQAAVQQAGGADVGRLADQLMALSTSLVETRARLTAMDEVLKTFEGIQRLMEREQELKAQLDRLRGMIEHVERVKLDQRLGVLMPAMRNAGAGAAHPEH